MILVEKEIASTGEELFKRDACQVRPMVRCPSVPVDSSQPASQQAPRVDHGSDLSLPLLHLFASAQMPAGFALDCGVDPLVPHASQPPKHLNL